jgi:photosystem II stability/assembly factor-like uncharacterized protein
LRTKRKILSLLSRLDAVSNAMNSHGHYLRIALGALLALSLPITAADRTSRYAVYRSEDQGQSWSQSGAGLPADGRINAFASSENSFIAGTDSGIFNSTNAGKSWQPSTLPAANASRVTSLAAVSTGLLFAGTTEGFVLSSIDQGRTWQENRSFPRRNVRSFHSLEGTLYVGTDADYVYKSSDLGKTWTHLADGLPSPSQVFALASVSNRLLAGLYAQGLYVWNTTDKKWRRVGESSHIHPLALASNGNTLIAGLNPGGIYWSNDLGQNWKQWSLGPASPQLAEPSLFASFDSILDNPNNKGAASLSQLESPVWDMAADSNIAIAGAGSGIYYSTDRARTWIRASNGLPATSSGIAFLIHDNLILAAIHERPYEKPSVCDAANSSPQKKN